MGLLVLTATVGGCGPRVSLPPPAGWPAEWHGRHLYNTPDAFIYASNPAAAGDVDRVVQEVTDGFVAEGGQPTKGLIVVTDVNDDAIFATAGDARRLAAAAVRPAPDWQTVEAEADRHFLSPEQQLLSKVVRVRPADLQRVTDFPVSVPADVRWTAFVPTGSAIDRVCGRTELSLTLYDPVRIPFLTVLGLPTYAQNQKEWCRMHLFEQLADLNPAWDETQRQTKGYAYWETLPIQRWQRRFGTFMPWP